MWYIVPLDSSRVATLVKVRSGTLGVDWRPDSSQVELHVYTSIYYEYTANRTLPWAVFDFLNGFPVGTLTGLHIIVQSP